MHRALAAVLLVAWAAEASDFGREGQSVLTGSASFSHSETGDAVSNQLLISPGLAYFVSDRFAVGGAVSYQLVNTSVAGQDQGTQTAAGFDAYASVDVPLSSWLSLWPRAGLEVLSFSGGRKSFGPFAYAPFLVHPVSHFFFGAGPSFFAEVYARDADNLAVAKTWTFSVRSIIGGYF